MTPKYIIIHHSATSRDKTTFQSVRKNHMAKGWSNIGYHYFIESSGKVLKGRSESQQGAHCTDDGMNKKSIGICLAGNFETEHPSVAQLVSLDELLKRLMAEYKINLIDVLGHKEVKGAKTACPGSNLHNWIINYKTEPTPEPMQPTPKPMQPEPKPTQTDNKSMLDALAEARDILNIQIDILKNNLIK